MAFTFDEWFETFWLYYPRDLCDDRGPKTLAKAAAKVKVKSQKEADRIMLNTEARIRHSKYKRSQKMFDASWPHVRKYFTQKYYDWEIPSYTQEAKQAEVKTCKHCTEPVHGPNYLTCTNHLDIVDKPVPEPRADHTAGISTMKEALK